MGKRKQQSRKALGKRKVVIKGKSSSRKSRVSKIRKIKKFLQSKKRKKR